MAQDVGLEAWVHDVQNINDPLNIVPGVSLTSNGARARLVAAPNMSSAEGANGVSREYRLNRVMQMSANYADDNDLVANGAAPPVLPQPLMLSMAGVEALPAIWLYQTEARVVEPLPVTAPGTRLYAALRTPEVGTAANIRLRGSFPLDQFAVLPNNDPNHVQPQFARFSRSFLATAFAGVNIRNEGILSALPNGYRLNILEGARAKWIQLTATPALRRVLRQYIRAVLNRYATYFVPGPTVQGNTITQWVGNAPGDGGGNRFYVYDTSTCIYHYFHSLRRASGWWEDQFTSNDRVVQVGRDLNIIRKRVVRVEVGADQLHYRDYMTVIYDRLREASGIFAPNDGDVPYYAKCCFYIPQNQCVNNDLPPEAHMNFIQDTVVGGATRAHIRDTVTQALIDMLYKYPAANFTYYTLYAEFVFVKDQSLIDLINEQNRRRNRLARQLGYSGGIFGSAIDGGMQGNGMGRRLRLRGGAHAARTHHEKMFVKGSMIRRFTEEKSLFEVPHRPHETCMIMSLFRAERTIYQFKGFQLQDIRKGSRAATLGEYELMFESAHHDEFATTAREIPFVKRIDGKVFLRMGICKKYPLLQPGTEQETIEGAEEVAAERYLPGAFDAEEIRVWELAAEEMTAFMETTLQKDLNINNVDEICQAYADTFRICVSVYDLECRGTRIQVYTPENRVVQQMLQPGEDRVIQMVHIVLDSGHCHAVAHIQSFLASSNRSKALGVYQHCPFCDCRTSRELNSQERAKKHISECAAHEDGFTSRAEAAFLANLTTSPQECSLRFAKNRPSYYMCNTCTQEVTQANYMCHTCVMPRKGSQELIPNERIFVFDLEAAQKLDPMTGLKVHRCNCVIIAPVYGDTAGTWKHYEDEIAFVQALIAPDSPYKNGTLLAHNAGGYDCQFLLRILERWEVDHTYTPTPGTQHKFLQITLVQNKIRFLDFMRFVPGSLRSIAEAFGCELGKGDFPHLFNNGDRMDYRGALPPHNILEDDFWCQRHTKSESAKRHFDSWYSEEACAEYCTCYGQSDCTCGKKPWVFREELIRYCVQDVLVLAQVVKAYREELVSLYRDADDAATDQADEIAWKPVQLDPFSCMTIAQICIRMLTHGFSATQRQITTLHQRQRGGLNAFALSWMDERAEALGVHITHRGNWLREYYHIKLAMHFDGYAESSDTLFWFVDCKYWGCPHCCDIPWENALHPTRHVRYSQIAAQYQLIRDTIHREYRQAEVIWEHEYRASPGFVGLTAYQLQCNQLFQFKEAFYGGRTEVFQAYASPSPNERIEHHDVTSLYPFVYLAELPVGIPTHLRGKEIDLNRLHPTAGDRYFGFAKVFVVPPRTDRLGLLPARDAETGRLCFPVYPMRGVWGTQELYLAMQNGYRVTEVYELYHWAPTQRSRDYLRGYLNTYLRMKQESEGWKKLGASSNTPSEEEQMRIVEELYQQNGNIGRIRPSKVCINPVKRKLAKDFMNSLWGKWAQKEADFESMTVYGPAQFAFLWSHSAVEKSTLTFRETSPGVFKVRFQYKEAFVKHVPHGNVLLAARVTEAGRCVLHERMLRISPERIIYCDTDSIVFHRTIDMQDLEGVGLGKWVNEYPSKTISEFAALAPKMYVITFAGTDQEKVKAKGVMLSLRNCEVLRMSAMKRLLLQAVTRSDEDTCDIQLSLQLENMSIFTNCQHMAYGYATMLTRENEKSVRVVISKRKLLRVADFEFRSGTVIHTVPWGFQE